MYSGGRGCVSDSGRGSRSGGGRITENLTVKQSAHRPDVGVLGFLRQEKKCRSTALILVSLCRTL